MNKNYFKNRPSEVIDRQIESVKKLIYFFKKEFGLYAFICYGTLLGAVRENNVISHDSDYDIAYLSKGKNLIEVRTELINICNVLIKKNMLGKLFQNNKGKLNPYNFDINAFNGQMHVKTPDNNLYVDIFTSWFENGKYYLCPHIQGELTKADIVPFKYIQLKNQKLVSPKNPEKLIKILYGNDWNISQEKKSKKYRKWLLNYE